MGLVEDQHPWVAHELARDKDATGLTCGHGHDILTRKSRDAEALHGVHGAHPVFVGSLLAHREAERPEDASDDDIERRKVNSDLIVHSGAHDAERGADVGKQGPRDAAKPHRRDRKSVV